MSEHQKIKQKRQKRRDIRRKWEPYEELAILNYICDGKEQGYGFEVSKKG